ncbi:hypothetical protein CPB83DRAFT_900720 [Crepidotus variabilis]|uniref:Vacuolar membrane-associated protein IML1 n=1 Tax=Crepidotus variabilis TaxID=179855 RepID=A0A9P6BCB3_9AGAR|nr:hypothetical protein CPB83DRAFT_900720 [Crepidotus variabilis]
MAASREQSQSFSRRRSNTAQSNFRALPNTNTNTNSSSIPPPLPNFPPLKVGDSKVLHAWVPDLNINDAYGYAKEKEKEKEAQTVLFNHTCWPGVMEGDCLRVTNYVGLNMNGSGTSIHNVGRDDEDEKGFLFIVTKDEGPMKPQLQIQLPRPVADAFGLRNNGEVMLTKVDKTQCYADYVEFIFQDQYLGRNEMWRLGKHLAGQCIYGDQEISYIGGIVAKISNIFIGGRKVSSAYMTTTTKAIYRSCSAKITIFIQVCRELWEFASDGERYNEKIVHSFLPALFAKWREAGTNHTVTIVLVSRVFYEEGEISYAAGPLQKDERGAWYKDFFKVITDLEVIYDWKPTLVSLKNSFWDFQRDILLTHHYHQATVDIGPGSQAGQTPAHVRLVGRLSDAYDGPILEALNLGLNPTENHYIDRSLNLTGSTTILISPGTGYFRVSKGLLRLTTRRMLDQGFVCNLVVLGKEPCFLSPVMSFLGNDVSGIGQEGDGKERKVDPLLMDPLWGGDEEEGSGPKGELKTYWWEPFWMSTTFWDKQMYLPFRQDRFVARAKMHEIQMLGLLEHDVLSSIEVPYIPEKQGEDLNATIKTSGVTREDANKFDLDTFALTSSYGSSTLATAGGNAPILPKTASDKRASHRQSTISAIVRIDTIEESPKPPIYKELPPEDLEPVTPRPGGSKPASLMLSGLSTSPSQSSIRSARSDRSISSVKGKERSDRGSTPKSATLSKGIASKLAPSWLFNPFRSGPSEPQTTPVFASASPTSSSVRSSEKRRSEDSDKEKAKMFNTTPVGSAKTRGLAEKAEIATTPTATSSSPIRMPPPKPTVAASTQQQQIQPMAIRGKASNRTSWTRGLEEDALHRAAYMRRSPVNTPPSDSILAGPGMSKRRSTTSSTSGLGHSFTSSSSPGVGMLLNPTRPQANTSYPHASLARRWQHIFPKPVYKHDIKWKPIVTPGCLPLTVEHFPTRLELDRDYDVFSYEFIVDPSEMRSFLVKPPLVKGGTGDDLRRAYALVVMRGMAAVRLAQGFQFILRKLKRGIHEEESTAGGRQQPPVFRRSKSFVGGGSGGGGGPVEEEQETRPAGAAEVLRSTTDPVYLSMTNEIHRISYNGEAIQVKRYVRRMTASPPIHYKCLIWPKLGGGYTEHTTEFKSHGLENYGWNRLDMLVAGYEHDFNESMRYWRTRFIVIPTVEPPRIREAAGNEELNEEEARILGIERLAELFTKLRWQAPDDKDKASSSYSHSHPPPPPPVRFLPTTLDPATSVLDPNLMDALDSIHALGPLRKKMKSEREITDMTLSTLAKLMRDPEDGVPIKFHQWHGSAYPDSFVGYDFVSWLVREFRDVGGRVQATEWGNKLQDKGLFEHCRGKHSFLDGHYYYRLVGEYSLHTTPKYWFMKQDGALRAPYLHLKSSKNVPKATGGTTRRMKKTLILSQTMVTDIDPYKKSDQAESVILHHDIIHNPATVFHFELQWIGTTARCIEDQLKAWNRNIEDYGLRIVEAYVTQISDIRSHNPFQSCFPLRLALAPPTIQDLERRIPECTHPALYFEYELLRKFNFILDIEAAELYPDAMDVVYSYRRSPYKYSQFVHATGVAFVQVIGGTQGFLFLTNRLMAPARGLGGGGNRSRNRYKGGLGGLNTLSGKVQDLAREAEKLREEMEEFCENPVKLERFYDGLVKCLPVLPAGPGSEEPPPLSI